MKINQLFRLNHIRNHLSKFGFYKGIEVYFKLNIFNKKQKIEFRLPEYMQKITLRKNSSDIKVFYQIIYNEEYNFIMQNDPKVILDLGSNIGLSAIYFAKKYPQSKIIAVEPEKENFAMCLHNTKSYKNINCINAAIWHNNESLKIDDNNIGEWGFSVSSSENKNKELKGIIINEICKKYELNKIDLLKIDIEGAEKELFDKGDLEWLNIVETIVIELHDWIKKGSAKAFFKVVTKRNFDYSNKGENCLIKFNSDE